MYIIYTIKINVLFTDPICQVHISKCPNGFTHNRQTNSCYKATRTPMTWIDAKVLHANLS